MIGEKGNHTPRIDRDKRKREMEIKPRAESRQIDTVVLSLSLSFLLPLSSVIQVLLFHLKKTKFIPTD